jgi:ribonuclease D
MAYKYIKDDAALRAYLAGYESKKQYTIALDLEAELYRHAYGETLCLVQIYDGTDEVIIDPLKLSNQLLKHFFENRDIMKIMYDGSSDLSLLKNALDIEMKSVLDLRPAVELLGYEKKDLHSVIAADTGVILENKAKFQKQNWLRRPITEAALDYALNDVRYLFRLKDAMLPRLYQAGLMETYILKNLQVQNKDYARDPNDRYRKVKGFYGLLPAAKAVFRLAYDVRDAHAKRLNMPPHNVISGSDLINLAKDPAQIETVRFPRRFSAELIRDIKRELRAINPSG